MNKLTFNSSWGELITDLQGNVIEVIGDKEFEGEKNYLHNIKKVDVKEYETFLKKLGHDPKGWTEVDILAVGLWDKDGNYDLQNSWRDEMYFDLTKN